MTPLARGEVRLVPLTVPQSERLAVVNDAITRAVNDPELAHVVEAYGHLQGVLGGTRRFMVEQLLQYVQGDFRREIDPEGKDLLADPIATFRRRVGDCLSLSALFVTLLRSLGVRASLAAITRPCERQDHVAVLLDLDGLVWADPMSMLPLGQVTSGISCPLPESVSLW